MFPKKNSVADVVAVDMADIIESPEHRSVFSKPLPPTEKQKVAQASEQTEKAASSTQDQFRLVVEGMAKMSEVLDALGLAKSALFAVRTLEQIVAEAKEADMDEDDSEEDEDESEYEKHEEAEKLEDEAIKDLQKAQKMEEDCADADGVPSIPLPGSPESAVDKHQQKQHGTTAPVPRMLPESKPHRPLKERSLPSGKPRGQSADDSLESAIDVVVKDDEGMADDGNVATASLEDLMKSLGLEVTAAAKSKDKKEKDKKNEKPSKAEKKKEDKKPKKKAWVAASSGELIVQALGYVDYDHEDTTEELAEQYDELRAAAADSNNDVITALAKKEKPKGNFIFPSSHPKVKSGDHFPIDTEGRARNALARANQYSKAPPWWKGSLQELLNAVVRAVKSKYKGIDVSSKSKKPGRG